MSVLMFLMGSTIPARQLLSLVYLYEHLCPQQRLNFTLAAFLCCYLTYAVFALLVKAPQTATVNVLSFTIHLFALPFILMAESPLWQFKHGNKEDACKTIGNILRDYSDDGLQNKTVFVMLKQANRAESFLEEESEEETLLQTTQSTATQQVHSTKRHVDVRSVWVLGLLLAFVVSADYFIVVLMKSGKAHTVEILIDLFAQVSGVIAATLVIRGGNVRLALRVFYFVAFFGALLWHFTESKILQNSELVLVDFGLAASQLVLILLLTSQKMPTNLLATAFGASIVAGYLLTCVFTIMATWNQHLSVFCVLMMVKIGLIL